MPKHPAMTKGAETRRAIIRQAAPIFNRRGYEGAAMSDLMAATGLEKGGIYRHFKNKQQLAAEAFDYAWDVAFQLRTKDTEQIPNSVDRLQQLVRNFRERREGLVPGGCPLLNTAVDADNGNPLLRRKAERALEGWMNRLRKIVEQGKRAREIRPEIAAGEVAAAIISTLEGSLMISRLQRSERAIDQGCRHLARYLESEVRAPKSAKNAEPS
ncbi:MAG TPA: TetR/AcrR family transcriptional regulator [Candidatus Dormibacteraeota bacterium]|nr:TetR/AcrR family transcriptional regulator [Candidatus Dormibacteraeota bacterium]